MTNEYAMYLISDWWRGRRRAFLATVGDKCQKCGKESPQVHHKNYDNLYGEKDEDLEALCRRCHQIADPEWFARSWMRRWKRFEPDLAKGLTVKRLHQMIEDFLREKESNTQQRFVKPGNHFTRLKSMARIWRFKICDAVRGIAKRGKDGTGSDLR